MGDKTLYCPNAQLVYRLYEKITGAATTVPEAQRVGESVAKTYAERESPVWPPDQVSMDDYFRRRWGIMTGKPARLARIGADAIMAPRIVQRSPPFQEAVQKASRRQLLL